MINSYADEDSVLVVTTDHVNYTATSMVTAPGTFAIRVSNNAGTASNAVGINFMVMPIAVS